MPRPSLTPSVSRAREHAKSRTFHPIQSLTHSPHRAWRALTQSVSNDREVLLLTGVFLALALWFVLAGGPEAEPAGALETPRSVAGPEAKRMAGAFDYVPAGAKGLKLPPEQPIDNAVPPPPAPTGESPRVDVLPIEPSPQQTGSVEAHALLAEPLFDPLGSAVLSGLPGNARLSAGAQISAKDGYSDWAVAFGDLDNLIVHLPGDRQGPIRTRVDLRTRAGVLITSLNVEVREDDRTTPSPIVTAPAAQPGGKAVKAARSMDKSLQSEKTRRAAATSTKPGPIKPLPAASKPAGPAAGKPDGIADGVPSPLPAPVFFKPDPKDSSLNGLSPTLRDDPRFMTLRGLGMGPMETPGDEPLLLFPFLQ
ncbi:MAG: hypothetical protein MUC37_12655 [Hyphomicrobium sp.]|nr:hypothetical protein [Hyphomicrobium sp.]